MTGKEFELGFGSVMVSCGISDDGRCGIRLRQMDTIFVVGEDLGDTAEDHIIPGESVVIWLDSVDGAMVLKEAVDEAIQRVIDSSELCVTELDNENRTI